MPKNKYYVYVIPSKGDRGVTNSWAECEKKVKGVENARYRGFAQKEDAEKWLAGGAFYEKREKKTAESGIYFDAGTGRGNGVEISVTDEKGKNLLATALPKSRINAHGKHLIKKNVTNNYGELLACKYALKIALARGGQKIFGDSRLIIDYWSKGRIKMKEVAPETVRLSKEVKKLRAEFEKIGGTVGRISGNNNPSDLGFHR